MYKDVNYTEHTGEMLKQLEKGAFLTVKTEDELNTMTIGWGSIGFIWNRPILMVLVRYSRYTYKMLEKAKEFTVSVPLNRDMKRELGLCGTKSKRDIDKFKECNLTPVKGRVLDTPIIGECDLHYECKVVYQQAMEPALLNEVIKGEKYSNNDYHILYYGEIVDSYIRE